MEHDKLIEMIQDPARRPPPGSAEHRAFLACLQDSPELRAMYEQQQGVWDALDSWAPVDPSPGFDQRLYEKLEGAQGSGAAGWRSWLEDCLRVWKPGLAAGLAALILIAGAVLKWPSESGIRRSAAHPPASIETESVEQVDQALDDIEMLTDFETLLQDTQDPGKS